jgi:hypothetical protein
MKFKVGDLITTKVSDNGNIVFSEIHDISVVEAIILKHWQTEQYWTKDVVDNVQLYITFDAADPTAVGDIDMMTGFKEEYWSLKNEA